MVLLILAVKSMFIDTNTTPMTPKGVILQGLKLDCLVHSPLDNNPS